MNHQTEALPGMATPPQQATTPTVYLEVDGKPHPANDCHWIEIAACGCIGGVSRAGSRIGSNGEPTVYYTGQDAFLRDKPKVVREYEEKTSGSRYQLITHQQFRETYSPQMGPCLHTPPWGIEPLPCPDGWAWKTTDGSGDRSTFRRHLVPAATGENDIHKVTAICGKEATRWRWKGESHHLYDTIPCGKCLKQAPNAVSVTPAVVDVPTGDLL
jgi:hypothetical protein